MKKEDTIIYIFQVTIYIQAFAMYLFIAAYFFNSIMFIFRKLLQFTEQELVILLPVIQQQLSVPMLTNNPFHRP